ncbi:hypothetical protein M422DRAFT_27955 [Sphaerobolus stellatus SS14]|nr:hypothetical protein M422DRAFT_27955 [Sphaerobolus stellatus SS14]
MSTDQTEEREIPLIQRGIVDNCFEEGQYEYGIDVMDKLRAKSYKPAPLHIRQLVYIALYPLPPKRLKALKKSEVPLSPTKAQLQRQKDDMWPKPAAKSFAIALLQALVVTNAPASLMRGLPYYSYINVNGVKDVDPFKDEGEALAHDDNTPLKEQLRAFAELKDVWPLLRKEFITRQQEDSGQQTEDDDVGKIAAVGPYAWGVLEWLIQLFEKDQMLTQGSYSPHLVTQIPPPRSKKGPRWEVEPITQIIRASFSNVTIEEKGKFATFEKRCDLGSRLLALMVNLSLTEPPLFEPSHFLRSVASYLPEFPLQSLEAFLTGIPPHQIRFKMALLDSFLSIQEKSVKKTAQKTPAAPRARPRMAAKAGEEAVATPAASVTQNDLYPLLSEERIFTLLSKPSIFEVPPSKGRLGPAKVALGRFHLLSAIYILKLSGSIPETWEISTQPGRLREHIQLGYARSESLSLEDANDIAEIQRCRSGAEEILKTWESLANI